MAGSESDPFQARARAAGPLAPGSFRAVPTDSRTWTDFADLAAARAYADDVASEADYEFIPPTAYVYDSGFNRVYEGRPGPGRSKRPAPRPAASGAGPEGLLARLRRFLGGR